MGGNQIFDMDIVPDRSSVVGRVVISKDGDFISFPQSGCQNERDKVGFRGGVILPDVSSGSAPAALKYLNET